MRDPEITAIVDRLLIDAMPAALLQSIDDCLAAGADPAKVLVAARQWAAPHSLTILGIEAYLEAKGRDGR